MKGIDHERALLHWRITPVCRLRAIRDGPSRPDVIRTLLFVLLGENSQSIEFEWFLYCVMVVCCGLATGSLAGSATLLPHVLNELLMHD